MCQLPGAYILPNPQFTLHRRHLSLNRILKPSGAPKGESEHLHNRFLSHYQACRDSHRDWSSGVQQDNGSSTPTLLQGPAATRATSTLAQFSIPDVSHPAAFRLWQVSITAMYSRPGLLHRSPRNRRSAFAQSSKASFSTLRAASASQTGGFASFPSDFCQYTCVRLHSICTCRQRLAPLAPLEYNTVLLQVHAASIYRISTCYLVHGSDV